MIRMASAGSRCSRQSTQPRVLRVGPRQHLGRVGDVGDQVGHRALGLGHRRDQRGGARRLGEPDVEAHVGAPVGGEVVVAGGHLVDQVAEQLDRVGSARSAASDGDAELDREPHVAAVAPVDQLLAGWRSARGASATNVPPPRPRTACRCPLWTSAVSAWRSVERAIPSCSHRSRSGGSRVPGGSSPSLIAVPSRSSVSSNAVVDWTGAKTASAITAARTPGLAPSR